MEKNRRPHIIYLFILMPFHFLKYFYTLYTVLANAVHGNVSTYIGSFWYDISDGNSEG